MFIPPKINDQEYVDGGLVAPRYQCALRATLVPTSVIAVDVSSGPLNATPVGIYEQVMHSFDIMGRSLAKLEAEQADVVIRPDTARIASTDFNARAAFIQIGQSTGTRFAPGGAGKARRPARPEKSARSGDDPTSGEGGCGGIHCGHDFLRRPPPERPRRR